MGWKDAGDAVVYPDGSQVKQPKALCELQGYVFDAWRRMAEVYDALRRARPGRRAATQGGRAASARFEERFWCEEIGSYCLRARPGQAADRDRRLERRATACGAGSPSPERAARVVERLMQPDMWSGWGIRTLSADNPAYNPHSYQRGSVWPHDNGIIALGFKRYGFAAEAARVARDISEAASYFVSYRLPELYAGIARTRAFPSNTRKRTSRKRGPRGARPTFSGDPRPRGRRAEWSTHRVSGASGNGCPKSRCVASTSVERRSTFVSSETVSARAGKYFAGRADIEVVQRDMQFA